MTDTAVGNEIMQKDAVVVKYQRLVEKLAFKYGKSSLAVEDLVQEGMIGLLKAMDHYRAEMNTSFATFAYFWIKKYMILAIQRENTQSLQDLCKSEQYSAMHHESLLRSPQKTNHPTHQIPLDLPVLEGTIIRLCYREGRTIREIAQQLGISNDKVKQIRQKALRRLRTAPFTITTAL